MVERFEMNVNFRWKNHPQGEIKLGQYYVDSYDPTTRTAFKFNGCFHPQSFNPVYRKTFLNLSAESKQRAKHVSITRHHERMPIFKNIERKQHQL